MGSSGKKGGGGASPQPTSEYQRYVQAIGPVTNPITKALQSRGVGGKVPIIPVMTEQEYYADKQYKQQKELQDNMSQQQREMTESLGRIQQEQTEKQATLLTKQKEEATAAQKEAYLSNQRSTRDSLFMERQSAEGAAVDYVNSQIAKEKSNASLYGMKYDMTDEDKKARVADYFGTIWNADNESKLTGLMKEVGKPDTFTDFVLQRGSGATIPKGQTSADAKSEVVERTKGTKSRSGNLSSLLTSGLPSSSTTLLGG